MKRQLLFWAVIAFAALVFFVPPVIRIGPDEVGARTNNVGWGGRGVVPRDFGPGWHWNLPFLHTWNVFPAHVRRVELTKNPLHRSALGGEALLVQSGDGDRVMLDLHIFFRVQPGLVHRMLQDSGPGDDHVRVLETMSRDRLRAHFGTLRTEEFYDPEGRYERSQEALASLREVVATRFLEVVDLMIEDVEFEPKYEQVIRDKKLADQKVELSKAEARAAAEAAAVHAIRLETEKRVRVIEATAQAESARIDAEAQKYAAERRAEANLYKEELRAKGTLSIALAEAKVKRAKTQAVEVGGGNLAAFEAVRNLRVDSIAFPTAGRDWFDVREMARLLGASAEARISER